MNFHSHVGLVHIFPVFLLFLLAAFPVPFLQSANSILGRLVAVCIILAYTSMHMSHGLFAVLCVILFYLWLKPPVEEGFREAARNSRRAKRSRRGGQHKALSRNSPKKADAAAETSAVPEETFDSMQTMEQSSSSSQQERSMFDHVENMANLADLPPDEMPRLLSLATQDRDFDTAEFRHKYCDAQRGDVRIKGMKMKSEMLDHIIGDYTLDRSSASTRNCNPCDPACGIRATATATAAPRRNQSSYMDDEMIRTPLNPRGLL